MVLVAMHPFHEGVHIDNTVDELARLYDGTLADVSEVSPGKKVVIVATRWTDAGKTRDEAVPLPENAVQYFYKAADRAADNDVNSLYFQTFDEQCKGPEEFEQH